jgi:DnaJ-class molecular chaperone
MKMTKDQKEYVEYFKCKTCNGTGKIINSNETCSDCMGNGYQQTENKDCYFDDFI